MPKRSANLISGNETDENLTPKRKRTKLLTASEKRKFQVEDLSADCLLSVFAEINIWHHNRLRATCKYFRDVHDLYLTHAFQKAMHSFAMNNSRSFAAAILYSIKKATEVYVNEGYETTLNDCLLPLLRKAYRTPFDLENQNIKIFLTSFYDSVDNSMKNPMSQRSTILYIMAMLNLLKSFRGHELNATDDYRSLLIAVILPKMWMGTLYRNATRSLNKCNAILVMLSLVLIGNISSQALKYVYEFEGDVFLFGNDASDDEQHCSNTEYNITVRGNARIRAFFRNWLECGNGMVEGRIEMPENLKPECFEFEVRINSKSVLHWGCQPTSVLHIKPRS